MYIYIFWGVVSCIWNDVFGDKSGVKDTKTTFPPLKNICLNQKNREVHNGKIYLNPDLFKLNFLFDACTSVCLYFERVILVNMKNLIAFVQGAAG